MADRMNSDEQSKVGRVPPTTSAEGEERVGVPACNCASHGSELHYQHGLGCPYGKHLAAKARRPATPENPPQVDGAEWTIYVCELCGEFHRLPGMCRCRGGHSPQRKRIEVCPVSERDQAREERDEAQAKFERAKEKWCPYCEGSGKKGISDGRFFVEWEDCFPRAGTGDLIGTLRKYLNAEKKLRERHQGRAEQANTELTAARERVGELEETLRGLERWAQSEDFDPHLREALLTEIRSASPREPDAKRKGGE